MMIRLVYLLVNTRVNGLVVCGQWGTSSQTLMIRQPPPPPSDPFLTVQVSVDKWPPCNRVIVSWHQRQFKDGSLEDLKWVPSDKPGLNEAYVK